ncbi:hypothetical protein FORC47_p255 (plasmid) [Bacillus cereus]|nr:hypothetical protein FORC47_p255 [Bacillus cereus]
MVQYSNVTFKLDYFYNVSSKENKKDIMDWLPPLLILLVILNVVSATHTFDSNIADQIVAIYYGPFLWINLNILSIISSVQLASYPGCIK